MGQLYLSEGNLDASPSCRVVKKILIENLSSYSGNFSLWDDMHSFCVSSPQEKYKMMPFHGCYLSFHGFSDEEKKHMEESTEQQGMFCLILLCYSLSSQPKTAETYQ